MGRKQAHCSCPSCGDEPRLGGGIDWPVVVGGMAAALVGWVATVLAIVALS